jgi:hypothetical protein
MMAVLYNMLEMLEMLHNMLENIPRSKTNKNYVNAFSERDFFSTLRGTPHITYLHLKFMYISPHCWTFMYNFSPLLKLKIWLQET